MHSYLTENQFFAPISTFTALAKCDCLILEGNENYQKRGFRNRCIIDSAQGPLTLSIPLSKGKNESMPIKEVTINYDTDWRRLHLQSIKSNYGNAPYFEHIYPIIEAHYTKSNRFLFDFNYKIFSWLIEFIALDIEIKQTSSYDKYIIDPKIKDARNLMKSNNYAQITSDTPTYSQVFEENHAFLPNLSILDLIFCTGKASLSYLS